MRLLSVVALFFSLLLYQPPHPFLARSLSLVSVINKFFSKPALGMGFPYNAIIYSHWLFNSLPTAAQRVSNQRKILLRYHRLWSRARTHLIFNSCMWVYFIHRHLGEMFLSSFLPSWPMAKSQIIWLAFRQHNGIYGDYGDYLNILPQSILLIAKSTNNKNICMPCIKFISYAMTYELYASISAMPHSYANDSKI